MLNKEFDFKALIKERGEKKKGFVELAQKIGGDQVKIPYIVVAGKKDGPTLLVDCGHHGDEYEGTEGIIKATEMLNPDELSGTLVAVPALNFEAMCDGQRVARIDWSFQDMNRAYPGNFDGQITKRVTAFYRENFIKNANYMISFHGGGNSLYLEPLAAFSPSDTSTKLGAEASRLAHAFGVKVIWADIDAAPFLGAAITATNEFGIPMVEPEVGGQCVRHLHREENVNKCANGIINVMKAIGMLEGEPPKVEGQVDVGIEYLHTDEGGFHQPKKRPMEACKKGDVLSEITDLFGHKIGEVIAPYDGMVIGYWSYSTIHPGNWAFLYGRKL